MESVKIKFLLAATGLSSRQAGELLGFSQITVKLWCSGDRVVPSGVIDSLRDYYDRMRDWAAEQSWPVPDVATDSEARKHGFMGVSSYRIAASMVFLDYF